jgi:hypothetical protein
MGLADLTRDEREVERRCLVEAADGPYFPDWEFETLFGVTRSEVSDIIHTWPSVDDRREVVRIAIGNAFANLLGYPHGDIPRLERAVGIRAERIEAVFLKWRELRHLSGPLVPNAMTTGSDLTAPLVVRVLDDPTLIYLASVEDLRYDGLDCLWSDAYEGWDARGHRFEARRHYSARRWWERLLGRWPSHLVVTLVEPTPSREIGSILAQDLQLQPTGRKGAEEHRPLRDLMRLGIERQAAKASVMVPVLRRRPRWLRRG